MNTRIIKLFILIMALTFPVMQLSSIAAANDAGQVQVTLYPKDIQAEASWKIDGGSDNTSGNVSDQIAGGVHTISFSDITGWETPPSKTIFVYAGKTVQIAAFYKKITGSVSVAIEPGIVLKENPQWRIDQGQWHSSGDVESHLAPGVHMIELSSISGWIEPGNQEIVIEENTLKTVTVSYLPEQESPMIRIDPNALEIFQEENIVGNLSQDGWVSFSQNQPEDIGVLPAFDVVSSDDMSVQTVLATPGMYVEDKNENGENFQVINAGDYQGDLPAGSPNLPVIRRFVYIPKGKTASVQVTLNEPVELANYLVYPVQELQLDVIDAPPPEFAYDEAVYNQDMWIPQENVTIGDVQNIRGHDVRMISVCPFSYNPARKTLKAYPDIDIEIIFGGQAVEIDSRFSSPEFDRFIRNIVLNADTFSENVYSEGGVQDTGCELLIITPPEFSNAANTLSQSKNYRGIATLVKTTDDTGKTSDSIKQYIQNAYDNWSPAPTYVILLGDVEYIPTIYPAHAPERGTDLYYSTVSGDDYYPDIFIGRISVDDGAQAETIVSKIINYETNPPDYPPFYANTAHAAYFQDDDNNGYADRRFLHTSEEIRSFLVSQGYRANRIYCTNSNNPTNYNNGYYSNGEPIPNDLLKQNGFLWDGEADDIVNAVNNGVFLLTHRDHGMDRNGGYSHTGWGDPYFVETHLDGLTNGDLLPLVLSFNCQSGWFDGETYHLSNTPHESFAEIFLRKENGGAIAVVGACRNSYSGLNDWMINGIIDGIWPNYITDIDNNEGQLRKLGPMLNHGKMVMELKWNKNRTEYELFHLFGDPTLELWTQNPGGGGEKFTIYNDGASELSIIKLEKENGAKWLDFVPKAPFVIPAKSSRDIWASVDWSQTNPGENQDRIIVTSSDQARSPYAEGVYITAQTKSKEFTLSIDHIGNGTASVNGVPYSLPMQKKVAENQTVTLKAVPEAGWTFQAWEIDGVVENSPQIDILMDADHTATVTFSPSIQTYTLNIDKTGEGKVKINGIETALPFTHDYEEETVLTIEALPADKFLNWSGDLNRSDNPIEFEINSDTNLICNFDQGGQSIWEAVIHGQGEVHNQIVSESRVTIGIADQSQPVPASRPVGEYTVSLKLWRPGWEGPYAKDIRQQGEDAYSYILEVDPHGNYPPAEERTARISWNPDDLSPEKNYRIRKGYDGTGDIVISDMREQTFFDVIGVQGSQYFTIEYGKTSTVELPLKEGWNLVSLPVVPEDASVSTLFPEAIIAYVFNEATGVYEIAEALEFGKGYWIKMPCPKTYNITGRDFNVFQKEMTDGWYLVGGISSPAIPSCEQSEIHVFDFKGFYVPTDVIYPGKGYWIKMDGNACNFHLTPKVP